MAARLMVLYPPPVDPETFEAAYLTKHIPLMRRLVGKDGRLSFWKVVSAGAGPPPFYRIAEIEFASMEGLRGFIRSDETGEGRASSEAISTGGLPQFLLCEDG